MRKIGEKFIDNIVSKKLSKSKVLFYDSGIGGLAILDCAMKICPSLDYYYYADYQHMPLGGMDANKLIDCVVSEIGYLVRKFGTGVVVVACNTATSVALSALRERMSGVEFVGTEPATKVAFDRGYARVALIATPNTIRFNRLVRSAKRQKGENLLLLPQSTLASLIEKNIADLGRVRANLVRNLPPLKGKIDCLVTGCTHYTYIEAMLSGIVGVPCINGNWGVATRLKEVCRPEKVAGQVRFFTNDKSKQKNLEVAWGIMREV